MRRAHVPRTESSTPAVVEEEDEDAIENDTAPDGAACESTATCAEGQHCRGPIGCEAPWACGPARECGDATVSYCGCDGVTFYALENCPGAPFQNVGPCAALGAEAEADAQEAALDDSICTQDSDCANGFVCAGIAGCSTYWTCVRRRRVRCAREATTFCSCDGETISSATTCAGRPYLHRGECGAPATEPPPPVGGPIPGVHPSRELGYPR